jgi:hypothetical protein
VFDLLDRPLHWILVKWPGLLPPEDDNAVSTPGMFEVELRVDLLDRDEAMWRFPGMFGLDDENEDLIRFRKERGDTPTTLDSFLAIVMAWRKIKANGRAVELNPENAARLLQAPMFEVAFGQAYILALGGRVEEREKNLPGSPSDGRADGNDRKTETPSKKTASGSASTPQDSAA